MAAQDPSLREGITGSPVLCFQADETHCLTASSVQLWLRTLAHIFCLSGSSQ